MALSRENVIRNAEKYVSKGKLEAAIKEYRKVLADNPNDANTLNRVGDLYARIERFDEAVKLFSQIAEQYTREGFFVKAIAIYKKIIKLDPTSLQVYEKLAELYYKQGLLNEARTQYQVLADYYQKHDNAASAIAIFQRMAELDPESLSCHLKLAELYASQRLFDKALKEYRVLADLMLAEKPEEAVQVYLKALDIHQAGDLDFVSEAIEKLSDKGFAVAAEQVLSRAITLNPAAQELRQPVETASSPEETDEQPLMPSASGDVRSLSGFSDDPTLLTPGTTAAMADEIEAEARAAAASSTAELDFLPASEDVGGLLGEEDDGSFTLDLDDDDMPDTLVEPPPDMLPSSPFGGAADHASVESEPAGEDDEFELIIDGFDDDDEVPDTLVTPPPDMQEPAAVEPTVEPTPTEPVAEAGEQEIEIDWSLDEMDLDLAEPAIEILAEDATASLEPEIEEILEPAEELDELSVSTIDAAVLEEGLIELEAAVVEAGVEPMFEPEPVLEPEMVVEAEADIEIELDELPVLETEAEAPPLETEDEAPPFETEDEAPPLETEDEAPPLEAEDEVFSASPLLPDQAISEVVRELEEDEPVAEESGVPAETEPPATPADDRGNMELPLAAEPDGPKVSPAVERQEEDFLAEAQVFSKYGLQEKARDRLQELLDLNPAHLGGLSLLASIELKEGRHEQVLVLTNEISKSVLESGGETDRELWQELSAQLMSAGYGFDGEQVIAAPGAEAPVATDNRISQLLDDLSKGRTASPAPSSSTETAAEEKPVPALISLVDELGLDELDEAPEETTDGVVSVDQTVAASGKPPQDLLDETGMSWLDEVPTTDSAAAGTPDETIFDEEDDFFDLAAELQRELGEEGLQAIDAGAPQDQSLEEIIEGFKQGVAENLSPEDYDTHFNLGIAYREMGLLDEAIGEFQLASKDARYLVDCSSLLGMCFLEKGIPELALKWYRKGLESPSISEDATMGLLYEMATAYLSLGDSAAAYTTFVEVYGINSNYRDVSVKIQELSQQQ